MKDRELKNLINQIEDITQEVRGVACAIEAYAAMCASEQPMIPEVTASGLAWVADKAVEAVEALEVTAAEMLTLKDEKG